MRRSSVPSSAKSSAGDAPVNRALPERLTRFPAPAHVQSSTCSRPSASRSRVGRAWLSGILRERELRALERELRRRCPARRARSAVSATTPSIRPVTSARAPSSRNGVSIDGVIEPTRRMARAGSRVGGKVWTYQSGSQSAKYCGRHSAGPADARTLPRGAQIAKIENAGFIRARARRCRWLAEPRRSQRTRRDA